MATEINYSKIKTPIARLMFPNLLEPREKKSGQKMYDALLMFDKDEVESDQFADMKEGARECLKSKWPKAKNIKSPFKDAENYTDDESGEYYAGVEDGSVGVNVSTKFAVEVLGGKRDKKSGKFPVLDSPEQVYAGIYVRCVVNAYTYDEEGNKGVAFGLQAIQKVGDGEKLGGGRVDGNSEFDDVEDYDSPDDIANDEFEGEDVPF